MPIANEERPGRLLIIIGVWLLCYLVARMLLPHSLELDEAEQIFFSQWLRLGYGPQPPLYNWLQQAVFSLTSASLFGITLLKSVLLFGVYVFYLAAARLVSDRPEPQSAALFGLLLLPQVSYMPLQDLTHTVLLLTATSFFYVALLSTLRFPSAGNYFLLGLACAAGILAKYNFLLVPLAAALAALPDREFRARLLDPRILISAATAAIIVAPHAAWVLTHLDSATTSTIGRLGAFKDDGGTIWRALDGLGSFAAALVAFIAAWFIVTLVCFRADLPAILSARSRMTLFLARMMAICTIVLIIMIVSSGTVNIRERWLDPFYLLVPLYFSAKLDAAGIDARAGVRRLRPVGMVVMVVTIAILVLRVATAPLTGDYTKLNIPFAGLSQALRERGVEPAALVLPDWHFAGNFKTGFPGIPVLSAAQPGFTLPFEASAEHPLVALWPEGKGSGDPPPALSGWLAEQRDLVIAGTGQLSAPYVPGRDGDAYAIRYALLTPKAP